MQPTTTNPTRSQPPPADPDSDSQQAAANPFRSERLRPGVAEYLFEGGRDLESLIELLSRSRLRGEIVGPHGTGKSTLLEALVPRLRSLGHATRWGKFAGGRVKWNEMPQEVVQGTSEPRPRIVIIDGFEQLSLFATIRWRLLTKIRGEGLIVTSHSSVGLPGLHRTHVTPAMAIDIARRIAGEDLGGLSERDVTAAFGAHGSNLRDALFALYDRFEAKRRE